MRNKTSQDYLHALPTVEQDTDFGDVDNGLGKWVNAMAIAMTICETNIIRIKRSVYQTKYGMSLKKNGASLNLVGIYLLKI